MDLIKLLNDIDFLYNRKQYIKNIIKVDNIDMATNIKIFRSNNLLSIDPIKKKVDTDKIFNDGYDAIIIDNVSKNKNNVIVYFEHYTSKFDSYNRAFKFDGKIILLTGYRKRLWYADLYDDIIKLLNVELQNRSTRIFFGDSMGEYAALLFSSLYDSIAISFGPQTFNLSNQQPNTNIISTNITYDLRDQLSLHQKSSKYILLATGECDQQDQYYWGDVFMAGYLIDVPKIKILFVRQQLHPISILLNFGLLCTFLIDNYKIFKDDMGTGLNLLKDNTKLFFEPRPESLICKPTNIVDCIVTKDKLTYIIIQEFNDNLT